MPETIQRRRVKASRNGDTKPPTEAIKLIDPPRIESAPVEAKAKDQGDNVTGSGPVIMADWLGIDEVGMKLIDIKIGIMGAIRTNREASGLTQAALAKRLGIARPRIAEMEAYRPEVSLDALILAFLGSGGTTDQLCLIIARADESMTY